MTIHSPRAGLLVPIAEKKTREGKELAPPLIGPIQSDLVPSQRWDGNLGHIRIGEAQFA